MRNKHWRAALAAPLLFLPALAGGAYAQTTATAGAEPADSGLEEIVVTGTRIPRPSLTAASPVASTSSEDIRLQQALTVQDFSTKLPQLAGGVRASSQGSDAFGAQVFDLRNFGQSRSLVLIDGTRATPFSFRNSVDVGSIPVALIKRVDVLTGGAAAVYGADAVAGVVNFILDRDFEGIEGTVTDRSAQHGGSEYGADLTFGGNINNGRGHVVVALNYTKRDEVDSGSRKWALTPASTIPNVGGVFTDVASGRKFGFDGSGQFTTSPSATSNISSEYPLIEPLNRYNATALYHYDLFDNVELYGRAMYTRAKTEESGTPGPNPPSIDQVVSISQNNPFLTPQIANQLTFVNGTAQMRITRSLAELGLITYHTDRETEQVQTGLRGDITKNIKWDAYVQYGRSTEDSPITGDGLVTSAAGVNNVASLANTIDFFGPNQSSVKQLGLTFDAFHRTREQLIGSGVLSGTSADLFSLPAGPVGFSLGYEYRNETGNYTQDSALLTGNTFRQGVQAAYSGSFDVKEIYGELLVPVLKDLPLIKGFDVGGAYRYSEYSLWGADGTPKGEFTWTVDDNIRFRGTMQRVIRTPNFSEYAAATSSLPFNNLVTVARLAPRYAGDPCVLGTGNAAQCARFGAPAVGSTNSFAPSYLEGQYFYGGNANIQPETGQTKTIGAVITPTFIPHLNITVDYYQLNLTGAIGVIQPVNALTSCYITNPTANNPLCKLVSRNPANGHLANAYVNNQNLGLLDQKGFDIGMTYFVEPDWLPGAGLQFAYQANIVSTYLFQPNAAVATLECAGTYGATCSSDGTTLVQPDYRHNASVSWLFDDAMVRLAWTRIGSVRNSAPGQNGTIAAQNYFDLTGSYKLTKDISVSGGIQNILDKDPPFVAGGVFNTFPDTYNVEGRVFSIALTFRQ
ncbi:TonB-dependent receptor plug domain-containing protein [Nitrospirillum viridazoti]|uniref:TonB-dependent receptor n=1 Tax=Nitrospirillum viridazoti CBAmc TaxID=1441467 RepID=A0A248K1B4_9PROT|nr:TonB-dependent receptor [Nitrospirillum amazonense]ASG24556.1 TonB-dependent receptor [Nitrospirillum amazonense CBAmc]TWB37087.1 TonB-dependent receptor-like protein [Nitrospirillum amazonense]